jgi:hypothetical protein
MTSANDFYQENRQCTFELPEIPKSLTDNISITEWILKQNIPYIELDLSFDIAQWQEESAEAEECYVTHRESQPHNGWKSCCIHGIDVDKTGIWQCYSDTEPEYHWTVLSKKTPNIKNFCQQLPFEEFARVRFMKLEHDGWVAPHNDSPLGYDKNFNLMNHLIPVNIAISHPEDCFMSLKNYGVVPWKTGDLKIVNITNDHSVINFSKQDRIHLIAHGKIGNKINEFCELIVRSYKKQYERNRD